MLRAGTSHVSPAPSHLILGAQRVGDQSAGLPGGFPQVPPGCPGPGPQEGRAGARQGAPRCTCHQRDREERRGSGGGAGKEGGEREEMSEDKREESQRQRAGSRCREGCREVSQLQVSIASCPGQGSVHWSFLLPGAPAGTLPAARPRHEGQRTRGRGAALRGPASSCKDTAPKAGT